jgi:hypothetical protein
MGNPHSDEFPQDSIANNAGDICSIMSNKTIISGLPNGRILTVAVDDETLV